METARQLGISLGRLEGREPRQITTYTYDDKNRVAQAITVTEQEWTDQERAWMLALHHYEMTLCRRCHTPLAESTDPDNDPDNMQASHHYQVDGPDECHSCKVLIRAEKEWQTKRPDDAAAFLYSTVLVPNTRRRRPAGRKG